MTWMYEKLVLPKHICADEFILKRFGVDESIQKHVDMDECVYDKDL